MPFIILNGGFFLSNPLVTVFITAYNSEKYISESLESVINQTYKNLEILIIDDGSSDDTNKIIRTYKDKRIRLITNDENMGIPFNRIKSVEIARGEFLAILDADDVSMLNRIENQVKFMNENKEVLVAGSFYKIFGNKIINRKYRLNLDSDEMKISLIFRNPLLNSSSIIRLNKIKELGINYNHKYFVAQDYGLWADISKVGEIVNIPQVLVNYRFGHNNITKLSSQKKSLQRKKVIDCIHNDLLDHYGFDLNIREKEIFNNFFNENEPEIDGYIANKAVLLFNKMIKINKQKQIFNESLFIFFLNKSIEESIKWSTVNFITRVKIWHKVSDNNIIYIFIKSAFFSLRQFAKKAYKTVLE